MSNSKVEFMLARRYPGYSKDFRKALVSACRRFEAADTSDEVVDEIGCLYDMDVLNMWSDPSEGERIEAEVRQLFPEMDEPEHKREILRRFIDLARQYEADLGELTAENHAQFLIRYREELRKDVAEKEACGQEYDKKAFFNDPEAEADFQKWCARRSWTIEQATALSLGKNPQVVHWEKLEPAYALRQSPFSAKYRERMDMLLSAVAIGELSDPTEPGDFVGWALGCDLDLPLELTETIPKAPVNVGVEKDLHGNVKTSLYAMIAGMAVEYCGVDYAYGITRDTEGKIGKLAKQISELGLKIEERAFKTHLKAALDWARSSQIFLEKQQKRSQGKN